MRISLTISLFFLFSCSQEINEVEPGTENSSTPDVELIEEAESEKPVIQLAEEDSLELNAQDEVIPETINAEEDGLNEINLTSVETLPEDQITSPTIQELEPNHDSDDSNIMYVMLLVLALSIIALIIITSLLAREVRWRKRRVNNESIVFPDAHLDVLEGLKGAWEDLYNQLRDFTNLGLTNQTENQNLSNKTLDSIAKFNSTIDAQQQEINRLKEGYDYSIKKHSVSALLEVNDLVESFLAQDISEESREKISKIDGYVKSNLEDLDVEPFLFESGISIRDLSPDEFEIDSIEVTDDSNLHEKVKSTIKNGYAFVHSNGKNIIKKAKLKVYKIGE